jgi:hypothetical protein
MLRASVDAFNAHPAILRGQPFEDWMILDVWALNLFDAEERR